MILKQISTKNPQCELWTYDDNYSGKNTLISAKLIKIMLHIQKKIIIIVNGAGVIKINQGILLKECELSMRYVAWGDYNVLSKNVTRDVSQSEKTLSEVI
jgi:hypothetical protein